MEISDKIEEYSWYENDHDTMKDDFQTPYIKTGKIFKKLKLIMTVGNANE